MCGDLQLFRRLAEFPYLPSPSSVINAALSLVQVRPGEVFADLGCGDGTVLIEAARKFHVLCVGFEIHPALAILARRKAKDSGVGRLVEIVRSDLFMVDLSRFNVIYVYPFPTIITKLSEKIVAECSKGTRVLVHDYRLANLSPTKNVQISARGFHVHSVYLYTV